jgi:glycosyltransferase involved in cell wall biosynthesis
VRLRTLAGSDPRIQLVGHVSDQALLRELWCNCYAYLHGHSVGGTNPALLRAMGDGACALALDTVFNREVLADCGQYFLADPESVRALVEEIEANPNLAAGFRRNAPLRILANYSWGKIADQYERLFMAVV